MATQIPAVVGQPQQLVTATNSTGPGSVYLDMWNTRAGFPFHYAWATQIVGSPSVVSATIEGSLDGTTWYTVDTSASTTSELRWVVNRPVRYLRGNLVTLTGGTSLAIILMTVPS